MNERVRGSLCIIGNFEFCVVIGYIILMVSVRALVFLILMAKPGKRVSAFSIELRGANFWSARMACVTCAVASGRSSFPAS